MWCGFVWGFARGKIWEAFRFWPSQWQNVWLDLANRIIPARTLLRQGLDESRPEVTYIFFVRTLSLPRQDRSKARSDPVQGGATVDGRWYGYYVCHSHVYIFVPVGLGNWAVRGFEEICGNLELSDFGRNEATAYAYGTYLSYLHIIPDNYVLLAI